MSLIEPLPTEKLYYHCDPGQFTFTDTRELPDGEVMLGQERALEAFNFALQVPSEGYNLYAMGIPHGSRVEMVTQLLREHAENGVRPPDWCYVHDFNQPNSPRALSLPAGSGRGFRDDIARLLDDLRSMIPAALDTEEYKTRRQFIEQQLHERQSETIEQLREKARKQNVSLMPTPSGFAFAPIKDGQTLTPEIFKSLSEEEQQTIEETIRALQKELHAALNQFPVWQKEMLEKIRELNNEITFNVTDSLVRTLKEKYAVFVEIIDYLEQFQQDMVEHGAHQLLAAEEESSNPLGEGAVLTRYEVNLFVEQDSSPGAPIVFEDNPVLPNLTGQIEHRSQFGTLQTDLTLIKPGALHYASGGYLVLEVEKLLTKPYSWEALKRALMADQVRIDSIERAIGWMTTTGLEPQPIPLHVKVVLVGDPRLYYLLCQYDPEFQVLFKVVADFDDQVERTTENSYTFARVVAAIIEEEQLLPCTPEGVSRLIEQSSRMVADSEKLTSDRDAIRDLLVEANFNARKLGADTIGGEAVIEARKNRVRRNDRIRERIHEQILRDTLLIDSSGQQIGQINGLAVYSMGQYAFGKPSRITARVRAGRGGVIDIERKVELGGPTHSKGVLILSSFLATRYRPDKPLSLSASLVFEQSYGGVDGDSASSTELYALLSALAEVPINQSLAVTGSVNQFGQVQAIGGVNEKIEGFFDICNARGLTGKQGVLIPVSNVKHLMLRDDVVSACAAGRFAVYPITTIDEGIELLTGVSAGAADDNGAFPSDSINGRVANRLELFAQSQREDQQKEEQEETASEGNSGREES